MSTTITYNSAGEGTCSKSTPVVQNCSKPVITTTWQQPVITQVVTQVVVQEVVVEQPVVIQQPVIVSEPVIYSAPVYRGYSATAGNTWGFASASVSFNNYGSYYPATYWQENNRCNELANYRRAEHFGSSRGGYGYNSYGGRLTGENRNSGVRQMPPLGPRMR